MDVQGRDSKVRLIDLFSNMDTNGDGAVSLKEFGDELKRQGLHVPKVSLKRFFAVCDPEGLGSLNYKEMRVAFAKLAEQRFSEFKLQDFSNSAASAPPVGSHTKRGGWTAG